jgi:hypothetical protein
VPTLQRHEGQGGRLTCRPARFLVVL